MITERLMAPGSWRLNLDAATPTGLLSQCSPGSHIVVTPQRVDQWRSLSDSDLLSAALWTGVIVERSVADRAASLAGHGLAWWLGTPQGVGPILETAVTATASNLSTVVGSLLPSNGISVGTITNTGLSTVTASWNLITRREALTHACRLAGAEWRINPDFTFDAAAASTLFTSTPTFVLTRRPGGSGALQSADTTSFDSLSDAAALTRRVVVLGQDQSTVAGSTAGSFSLVDRNNSTPTWTRLVSAASDAAPSTIAANLVNVWSSVRQQVRVGSRRWTVTRFVQPGDRVWVHDPASNLVDTANQVWHNGELIFPVSARVVELTWPVERGVGVYLRRSGSTPEWVDLSDFVEWEDGAEIEWQISTTGTDLDDEAAALSSPAFLGVNADVADRANLGVATAFTPTWSGITVGTGGSAGSTGTIWRLGDLTVVRAKATLGTSGASVSGAIQLTNPPFTPAGDAFIAAGWATFLDDSTSTTVYGYARPDGANVRAVVGRTDTTDQEARNTSSTVPFTWAAGDSVTIVAVLLRS